MAKVHITNVVVLDNPSSFFNPFQFEITFECIEELKDDLEWKMIYVGSAESEDYDQVLDTIYVGPVPEGRHIFVFQADPPDVTKIPEQDVVGVTIVLLTCSYRGQEFVRVGYYVNNDYAEQEIRENPPPKPIVEKLVRNILASKPRVTRFKINWDDAQSNGAGTSASAATAAANGTNGNAKTQNSMNSNEHRFGSMEDEFDASNGANEQLTAAKNGQPVKENGPDVMMDDSSLSMPTIGNNIAALNENSNSLAMEC